MATTSIADKLAKLEKKIAKREKAIADETKELDKDQQDVRYFPRCNAPQRNRRNN